MRVVDPGRWMIALAAIGVLAGGCAPAEEADSLTKASEVGAADELWEAAALRFKPLPASAENPDNVLTAAKVELGRRLYLDTRLSRDQNISCDSCHALATFGVDNLPRSPGDSGELGGRNSPTVFNAALHLAQFWDGRAEDVEEQAGMPILNPVEMAIPSEEFLEERLRQDGDYREAFVEAFPGEAEPLTYANIRKALAAFERTLLTPSRFDDYLEGQRDALSEQEKSGLETFVALGCAACHNGVNIGAYSFRKFGIHGAYWEHINSDGRDLGRFDQTGQEEDKFVFRVASLRNIEMTAPYFHDGSVSSLEEAVRVMGAAQLGRGLSADEVNGVAAFLRSLTGRVPETARVSVEG